MFSYDTLPLVLKVLNHITGNKRTSGNKNYSNKEKHIFYHFLVIYHGADALSVLSNTIFTTTPHGRFYLLHLQMKKPKLREKRRPNQSEAEPQVGQFVSHQALLVPHLCKLPVSALSKSLPNWARMESLRIHMFRSLG